MDTVSERFKSRAIIASSIDLGLFSQQNRSCVSKICFSDCVPKSSLKIAFWIEFFSRRVSSLMLLCLRDKVVVWFDPTACL